MRELGSRFVPTGLATGARIGGSVATLVRRADTVFVTSSHPDSGADASHRGGSPGFVQIFGERTLRIPDYAVDSLFNTLGKLELDARVGLCICGFAGQQLLQLSGRARPLWEQDDPDGWSGAAGRFLEAEVDRWILRQVSRRQDWEYLDESPFSPPALAG